MEKCKHNNTEITLDDQIRCKDCGEILDHVQKRIGTANSTRMAKALLDEMGVTGKYIATGFNDGFVIYSRSRGNIKEEVLCRKTGKRAFAILKRVSVA